MLCIQVAREVIGRPSRIFRWVWLVVLIKGEDDAVVLAVEDFDELCEHVIVGPVAVQGEVEVLREAAGRSKPAGGQTDSENLGIPPMLQLNLRTACDTKEPVVADPREAPGCR